MILLKQTQLRRVFTAVLIILAATGISQARQVETITVNANGSFENTEVSSQADTLDIEGWTIETAAAASASYAIVDDTVKDGSRALRIDVASIGDNDWDIQVINEIFPVESGIIYNASIWARANATGSVNITAGNPAFNEFARLGSAEVTTEWQEYTFSFSVGADDTEGRTPLHFSLAGNDGISFWIDSLRVTYDQQIEPPTGSIAYGKPKWLGNVYSSDQAPLFVNYWNQVTPENAGKWGSVEGTRDQMNWGQLDAAYNLAKSNGLPFRFHILVWGGQQPGWINNLSTEEQLEEITEWFEAVAERYPNIDYLEVVNEPLHQRPDGQTGEADYWDALGGPGDTGFDWIITAFEMAREIFPAETKLMINDYGIISNSTAVSQYLEIINELKSRGLIDGIGVQAHAFNNGSSLSSGTTPQVIKRNLDMLATADLPIQATELDIDGNPGAGEDGSEAYQLEKYQEIFPVFWEHPAVEGVTLWGWRPGLWRSEQDAFIFDQRPKDAMDWLIDYVDTADVVFSVSTEDLINEVPEGFVVEQNYPNPFNPTTQISYTLPEASQVTINVYDISGRLVQELISGQQLAGNHTVEFNAANLASGIYLYEIRAGAFRDIKKMTLIK
jgi:GH35 family endo-1,4-beta-xylanase